MIGFGGYIVEAMGRQWGGGKAGGRKILNGMSTKHYNSYTMSTRVEYLI